MAFKEFKLINNKNVKIYKRKGVKHLKLSINSIGQLKVTIPTWLPYKTGLDFAHSRLEWIEQMQPQTKVYEPNMQIGKAHKLIFRPTLSSTLSYSIKNNLVSVHIPKGLSHIDNLVQLKAEKAAIEALRLQAKQLLPQRLNVLSDRYKLPYSKLKIKSLTSRWGSCDSNKEISLSLYLLILPWHLIDYVICHELTHTKVLKHGPVFWNEMEKLCPNYKFLKKEIRNYRPQVIGAN